jgi:pSer/pThr/pTyr-binding forkhead associated (FHA) protein
VSGSEQERGSVQFSPADPPGGNGPPPFATDAERPSDPSSAPGEEPMAFLLITEYGKETREYRIVQDQNRIGRDPWAEIVLRDIGVSRSHAKIVRQGKEFLIEDLGSRNGTLVNDRRLLPKGSCPLRHGDSIQVGRSMLRLFLRMSARIAASLSSATGVSTSRAMAQESESRSREQSLCLFRLQKLEASLLISREGQPAVRQPLKKDRVRIGRSPESDVVLSDSTVSLNHAEILYNKEGFHLVDRDSTVGTFLNGVSIQVARLSNWGYLRFGRTGALFIIHEEGREPPEPSFRHRDHLQEIYPERVEQIQDAFKDCRENGLDLAEELVLRGTLSPEEWWAAASEFQKRPGTGPRGWFARFLRRR